MAYDVSEHPLLSGSAKGLSEDLFAEHQAWAEDLLGISGTSYTGTSKARVNRAIALQINWQLALPKDIWFNKQTSSIQSKQNVTYRDAIVWVDPRAQELIDLVLVEEAVEGAGYGNIRSIR